MLRGTARSAVRVTVFVAFVVCTVGSGASAGAMGPPPWSPAYQEPDPEDAALDLVGTWGLDVVDADGLCVSILVPDWVPDRGDVGQDIADAFQDWDDAVDAGNPDQSLPWTEDTNGAWDGSNHACVGGDVGPVDVSIEVSRGGGTTQGTTQLARNEDGYIVFAQIKIKGKLAGPGNNSAEQIGLIARHEIGHALGLGHWNIQGQLMSSLLVDDTTTQPNQCEVDALRLALAWWFDAAPQPAHFDQADDPYQCNPT